MSAGKRTAGIIGALSLLLTAGCGGGTGASGAETLTLYTCVSDETIQPVIDRFEATHPESRVDLYRAPTGELNARVAGDVRSGGLRADVIWTCDPLTMQNYAEQELVGGWTPDNASAIPRELRTADYTGAGVLSMVVAHGEDVPAPETWRDLTGPEYADGVAVPDPAFAASALGALGYFSQNPDYGLGYYAALKQNGAVQVSSPTDVVTGVAEGLYTAGITIGKSAYDARDDGSPIGVAVPAPGAITIYSPIALARSSSSAGAGRAAKDFVEFVLSREGQQIIADSGATPTLPAVTSPVLPAGTPTVSPDWEAVATRDDRLLSDYQEIFGG